MPDPEFFSTAQQKTKLLFTAAELTQGSAAPQSAPADSLAGLGSRTLRILIVDDNTDSADALAQIVGFEGHEVTVAYDPEAAITAVAAGAPDVAIIDIGLPTMDGYTLCARLRELTAPRKPAFIALTGFGSEEHRAKSVAAGFDRHMVKPVDFAQLFALLGSTS